jgi:hypothetical protein
MPMTEGRRPKRFHSVMHNSRCRMPALPQWRSSTSAEMLGPGHSACSRYRTVWPWWPFLVRPVMTDAAKQQLRIDSLHERHTGLTPSISGTYYEAASVCLSRHHDSPVNIQVDCNGATSTQSVEFSKPDARMLNAWANDIDTTESGAYGVSLAAVECEENLVAIRRAETLTGADWYVAPIGTTPDDLESCFRLEVSGIDAGGQSVVEARLRQKIEQTRRGASNLPAIASVVGFREKAVAIRKVSDEK